MATSTANRWWPDDGPCVVLLVDDDPAADLAIRRMLAAEPRIELQSCDRRKAPMIARLLKPAVILQALPRSGDDLSVLIAFLAEPVTADIPVIMLLDADDADVVRRARAAGAADCLVKRSDAAEFVARVCQQAHTRLLGLQRDEALRALEDVRKELAAARSELARRGQPIHPAREGMAERADGEGESNGPDMTSPIAEVLTDWLPLAILVADDNVINQRVAAGLLKRLGYAADVVADGLAVLDRLEQRSYDVILLDRQMPRMDGHEAARRIRARPVAAGIRRPLLVAMSANDSARDREDGLAAGMDAFLPKPLNLETLKALLERHGARTARPS